MTDTMVAFAGNFANSFINLVDTTVNIASGLFAGPMMDNTTPVKQFMDNLSKSNAIKNDMLTQFGQSLRNTPETSMGVQSADE